MKVDGWMDVPIICISTWQLHTKRCVCVYVCVCDQDVQMARLPLRQCSVAFSLYDLRQATSATDELVNEVQLVDQMR